MSRARIALLVAFAALVGACGAPARPVDLASVSSAERPTPAGASEAPAGAGGSGQSNQDCGDPTASLRPSNQIPPGSAMARIVQRGRLIAGVDQNTYLFGFRNPATGNLEGFDIDMVRQVARALFGDPDKVQYKVITSADREKVLQAEEVDIVVRTFTINCERLKTVNFSTVYYTAGQRVLVDRGSSVTGMQDLGGLRVCANKGSTSLARIATHPARPIPVSVENWSDCLVMLQQGQVAAVSTDDTILSGMLAQDPNVKMVGPRLAEEPYGIGIPKRNTDMVRFVNAVLDRVRTDGTWQASYNRWLGGTGEQAGPPAPRYRD